MAPGRKTGGRVKGTPNKVTTVARSAFLATFGRLETDLETWIRKTAEGVEVPLTVKGIPVMDPQGQPVMVTVNQDPGKAAELIIRMAEYHLPKLGRQELVGDGGGAVRVEIVKYQDEPPT